MGQRCNGSVSTKHMGRDAFFADAVDFSTSWNIPFDSDYFHLADHHTYYHVFTVGDQHKRKSKRRYCLNSNILISEFRIFVQNARFRGHYTVSLRKRAHKKRTR